MSAQIANSPADHDSMFESVLARLDVAAKTMNLDESVNTILRNPQSKNKKNENIKCQENQARKTNRIRSI